MMPVTARWLRKQIEMKICAMMTRACLTVLKLRRLLPVVLPPV